jgi:hypothetical protein
MPAGRLLPQLVQNAVATGAAGATVTGLPHTVQNFEEPLTSLPHDAQTDILQAPADLVALLRRDGQMFRPASDSIASRARCKA